MVNIFPVLFRNILFVYFAFAVFFSLSLLVKGLCGVVEPESGTEELRTLHEKAPMRVNYSALKCRASSERLAPL